MPTEPDEDTRSEDEHDAQSAHRADRPPTEEEEAAAERADELTPEQEQAYRDAIERGAAVEGEGRIDL